MKGEEMPVIFIILSLPIFALYAWAEDLQLISAPLAQPLVRDFQFEGQLRNVDEDQQFIEFCRGIGKKEVDILFADRKITQKQIQLCSDHAIDDILEIPLAYDAILFQIAYPDIRLDLTQKALYQAIRRYEVVDSKIKLNRKKKWSELQPQFENVRINITQNHLSDNLAQLYMDYVFSHCSFPKDIEDKNLKNNDKMQSFCHSVRNDVYKKTNNGLFGTIKKHLFKDKNQLLIIPFYYQDETLFTLDLDGVHPTLDTIKSGQYPLSYPIYAYIKMAHIGARKGLKAFVDQTINKKQLEIMHAQKKHYIWPDVSDVEEPLRAYYQFRGFIAKRNNE